MMYKLAALFVFVIPIAGLYYRNRHDPELRDVVLSVAKGALSVAAIVVWIGLVFWLLRQGALQ